MQQPLPELRADVDRRHLQNNAARVLLQAVLQLLADALRVAVCIADEEVAVVFLQYARDRADVIGDKVLVLHVQQDLDVDRLSRMQIAAEGALALNFCEISGGNELLQRGAHRRASDLIARHHFRFARQLLAGAELPGVDLKPKLLGKLRIQRYRRTLIQHMSVLHGIEYDIEYDMK